ncbi:hypothetical protein AVEN_125475-1 [Araneus ventricosus]|uniref:Uncharacterized protein n=1 Tax=Araneus ventricosus TaxID=182803 RepID=A0A4Y2KSV5_ARAVE|nr:hypothetical protein AVEN_125475-1 [Araneus ventricosus]
MSNDLLISASVGRLLEEPPPFLAALLDFYPPGSEGIENDPDLISVSAQTNGRKRFLYLPGGGGERKRPDLWSVRTPELTEISPYLEVEGKQNVHLPISVCQHTGRKQISSPSWQ